jgi:hypothetical protein
VLVAEVEADHSGCVIYCNGQDFFPNCRAVAVMAETSKYRVYLFIEKENIHL